MRFRWIGLAVALLAGCGTVSHGPDDAGTLDPDAGPPVDIPRMTEASGMFGPEGGTLALGDLALEVPAGALDAMVEIRVIATGDAVPGPFTGFSPVYRFEPEGLSFATPAQVRLPFDGRTATASVFWTAAGSGAFVALPTHVEGRIATVETTHFSRAFVGTACEGDGCCGRANGDLDVLLMVDNSNSMTEEQASLREQLPRLARVLATGDLDDDGVQDFPALNTVRVGTVSSDMGTGGFTVPTCARSDFGDDGVLRTEGDLSSASCDATYPSYAELGADRDVEGFVSQVACTSVVGTGGCGFEQQLESVLKAVTPSTSSTRFFDDTGGQEDRMNAGFLRDTSVIATIVLTDENDCSASDPELFDPSSPTYGGTDLNLRCFVHEGAALHPMSRYVDGLRALRADARDVVFGLIAGVPADLVSDPSRVDYDAVLADPRMEERVDPATPNRLVPSCNTPGRGVAMPPRRLLEVARGLGPQAVVQSICQEDFTPVLDAILTRVAARVSGRCE